ncbi:MAG: DUF5615 family PIN-like protein [Candidatus Sericytochromatia bacterium]|nr:DUF5615 family PIN-like protein [Candidatus Tanganyikabacteria bacterium]
MRIKIDENLPEALARGLRSLGHDVDTVPEEGMVGRDDPSVWGAAQDERRFFITQDPDFSDVRKFMPGSHHGLLLVRLAQPHRRGGAAGEAAGGCPLPKPTRLPPASEAHLGSAGSEKGGRDGLG